MCLAVAQVPLGARSEHHWLRTCHGRLGHLFPYLPHQPSYHEQLKADRVTSVERRQVPGLPPMKIEMTEHQLTKRQCDCGHRRYCRKVTRGAARHACRPLGVPLRPSPPPKAAGRDRLSCQPAVA